MTAPHTDVPQDLAHALAASEAARATWERLPPSHRREYIESVVQAKRADTRAKRIRQAVARLEDAAAGKDTRLSQTSTRPLAAKIGVKPRMSVTLLNAEFSAAELLEELPEGASVATRLDDAPACVLLFVRNAEELEHEFPRLRDRLAPHTLLWVAYPKQSGALRGHLTRDRGWDLVRDAGYEGVNVVSVDDTWSAMRFVRR